ncbi:bacillithiol biosynthesis deacetylase BshB1 [Brevibacillus daliensis]|uniref:bacillithiol biosynthesis deacetylase BshB1 n=1 Tax=Brevibacillus daliensis TaxID=2892995 RepID=UPI001E2A526A|nr:bacillithiol biosynthesis deacetylase BshB1 [Brevibacillus daliensis]
MEDRIEYRNEHQIDILAIGAHPDDVEIGASGALLLAAKQGKRTGILDLTLAELSSNGTVETRQQEAAVAAQRLGLYARYQHNIPDRGLETHREAAIAKVVEMIRLTRPQIVLAPYWEDRHPDHGSISHIVKEAVFSAGIRKYASEQHLEAYRPSHFYYYFINSTAKPDFVINISDVFQEKIEVLRAYSSQFEKLEGSVSTPLTNGYLESVEYRERLFGQQTNVEFAEGYKTSSPLVLSSF